MDLSWAEAEPPWLDSLRRKNCCRASRDWGGGGWQGSSYIPHFLFSTEKPLSLFSLCILKNPLMPLIKSESIAFGTRQNFQRNYPFNKGAKSKYSVLRSISKALPTNMCAGELLGRHLSDAPYAFFILYGEQSPSRAALESSLTLTTQLIALHPPEFWGLIPERYF